MGRRTIDVHIHIVRLLILQDSFHDPGAIRILYRAPYIPWVFSIVEVGEDSQFEGTITFEGNARFVRVWVQDVTWERCLNYLSEILILIREWI
jgi:hypothetical protein